MNILTVTAVGNLAKNPERAVKGDRAGSYCPLDLNVPSRRGRRLLDVAGVRRATPSKEARSCRH